MRRNLLRIAHTNKNTVKINQRQLPYYDVPETARSPSVETESWQERKDGSVRIDQVIYLARENHKPIVLGKGGQQIKAVGSAAREELEASLERRVHLFIHVKVAPKLADDPARYRELGLEFPK